MILSRVRTGIQLDADHFVVPGVDNLFQRTQEEVTESYPFPIMPVHWMSRDDDPKFPVMPYAGYAFHCKACPNRTMRWGQAHPTWTHWALPFIAKWLKNVFD